MKSTISRETQVIRLSTGQVVRVHPYEYDDGDIMDVLSLEVGDDIVFEHGGYIAFSSHIPLRPKSISVLTIEYFVDRHVVTSRGGLRQSFNEHGIERAHNPAGRILGKVIR